MKLGNLYIGWGINTRPFSYEEFIKSHINKTNRKNKINSIDGYKKYLNEYAEFEIWKIQNEAWKIQKQQKTKFIKKYNFHQS